MTPRARTLYTLRQRIRAGARVPFFLKQLDQGHGLEKLPEIDGQSWAQLPRKTP